MSIIKLFSHLILAFKDIYTLDHLGVVEGIVQVLVIVYPGSYHVRILLVEVDVSGLSVH